MPFSERPPKPDPALLTPDEVAPRLRVDRRTVVRWCAAQLLPGAKKIGGVWRIPAVTVDAYEKNEPVAVAPAKKISDSLAKAARNGARTSRRRAA